MMMQSNNDVILPTSSTVMSFALMSSSASTTAAFIFFRSILLLTVEFTTLNIIENLLGKQITRAVAGTQQIADQRCRNIERRQRVVDDPPVRLLPQRFGIWAQSFLPFRPQ